MKVWISSWMSSFDIPGANFDSICWMPLVGSITLSTSNARFLRCFRASGEFLLADSRCPKSFSSDGIFLSFPNASFSAAIFFFGTIFSYG